MQAMRVSVSDLPKREQLPDLHHELRAVQQPVPDELPARQLPFRGDLPALLLLLRHLHDHSVHLHGLHRPPQPAVLAVRVHLPSANNPLQQPLRALHQQLCDLPNHPQLVPDLPVGVPAVWQPVPEYVSFAFGRECRGGYLCALRFGAL
jgi:hypothetical protein